VPLGLVAETDGIAVRRLEFSGGAWDYVAETEERKAFLGTERQRPTHVNRPPFRARLPGAEMPLTPPLGPMTFHVSPE
jgi:hypothetical protein